MAYRWHDCDITLVNKKGVFLMAKWDALWPLMRSSGEKYQGCNIVFGVVMCLFRVWPGSVTGLWCSLVTRRAGQIWARAGRRVRGHAPLPQRPAWPCAVDDTAFPAWRNKEGVSCRVDQLRDGEFKIVCNMGTIKMSSPHAVKVSSSDLISENGNWLFDIWS